MYTCAWEIFREIKNPCSEHHSVCATRVVLHSKYGKLTLDETRRARIDRHRPLTQGKRLEKQTMIVCKEKNKSRR